MENYPEVSHLLKKLAFAEVYILVINIQVTLLYIFFIERFGKVLLRLSCGLETFFVIFKQCDPKNHRGVSHLLLVVQVKKVLICFEGQLNEVLMASGQ